MGTDAEGAAAPRAGPQAEPVAAAVPGVLAMLGVTPAGVTTLQDVGEGNSSWLVRTGGPDPVVLRRYHGRADAADVDYEHAVLRHLAERGWTVPAPLGPVVRSGGRLWCLTRHVPGGPRRPETSGDRAQRGRDLARLHVDLRPLTAALGQRPRWRPQHTGVTMHVDIDWAGCVEAFRVRDGRLAGWAEAAAAATRSRLDGLGASDLPVTLVHGDFAEWNVHYTAAGELAGVIDFGLAHVDSRPYELAIARTYRAPEAVDAYRDELVARRWPLTDLEERALPLLHHAFRVDMVAWLLDTGRRTGTYDLEMIERQLERTGTTPP